MALTPQEMMNRTKAITKKAEQTGQSTGVSDKQFLIQFERFLTEGASNVSSAQVLERSGKIFNTLKRSIENVKKIVEVADRAPLDKLLTEMKTEE